jgi:hypothetical protein
MDSLTALNGTMMPGNTFLGMAIPRPAPEPYDIPGADLKNGILSLDEAQMDYVKAIQYYNGTMPEFFASLRLRIAMGATGVVFNFNFAKLPVDAVAERLEIAAIFAADPSSKATIQQAWKDNQLDLNAPDVMKKACKLGDAYVLVWPNQDGETDSEGTPLSVDIFYQSPRVMRVFYDDENENRKRYAIKRWQDSNSGYTFANLYYPDCTEKYMLAPQPESGEKPKWEKRLDEGDGDWPLPNPYGEVPVFHFRNEFPYGVPEHVNGYGPQDAIHKLVVSHMASVDYNAFPQRWAIMDPAYDTSEAAMGDEGEYAFSIDTGATLDQGMDPKSQLTADPASVWFMKGISSYGQFPVGDPTAFLTPFTQYVHALAVITQTPMHFMDPIVSNVSGESLRVIEAPFAKKVRNRQLSFGAAWRDVFRFVLKIKGQAKPADVQIHWVPAATVNDLSTLQGQAIKEQIGVPPRQLLEEQGYTPEQLDSWGVTIEYRNLGVGQGAFFETEEDTAEPGTSEEV